MGVWQGRSLHPLPSLMREAMFERYGQPVKVDTAGVLRALGLRRTLHPHDVYACRYSSMEAAQAFARVNRDAYGHDVLGPYETEVGPVNVVDMRRSLASLGHEACNPALPD